MNANSTFNSPLSETDPEIAAVLQAELNRQRNFLEMIASENFVSRGVLQAQGSVLTNKYAEGYPGKRYYGGCEAVDVAEELARDRAKALFGADQPQPDQRSEPCRPKALRQLRLQSHGMQRSQGDGCMQTNRR